MPHPTGPLVPPPGGISTLPGFAASVRLLLERDQYALTDIALMFGVSRERMRQLTDRLGLTGRSKTFPRGLLALRVWDDTQHRFVAVSRGAAHRAAQRDARAATRHTRQAAYQADLTRRRAHMTATYHALAAELGLPPTLAQWASRLLGVPVSAPESSGRLRAYWGMGAAERATSARAQMAAIRAAVGATHRARKGPKACPLYCRHGHPLFGDALALVTTAHGGQKRQCVTCRAQYQAALRAQRATRSRPSPDAARRPLGSATQTARRAGARPARDASLLPSSHAA